jgi:hypothetical protein
LKALPADLFRAIAHLENAMPVVAPAYPSASMVRDVRHMAQKVRALSHRISLFVRVGNRGFTFSISGWQGAV